MRRTRVQDTLPWQADAEEQRRLRRILAVCLSLCLVFAVAIPLLPVAPEPDPEPTRKPQLARLLLEEQPLPPPKVEEPPPPEPEPKPEPVVQAEPEPKPVEPPPKPEPKPEPPPEPPPQTVADAREKAASSGLLAFQDELAAMRDQVAPAQMQTAALTRSRGEAARLERRLVTADLERRSEGVRSDLGSVDVSANALSARETTRVVSGGVPGGQGQRSVEPRQAVDSLGRSDESVRRVFDRNKGAIYALYNRALRASPGLQGKVTLELEIDPSGIVRDCRILSSELDDPELEAKLLARVRMIDFGAEDVLTTQVSYAIDFMPY